MGSRRERVATRARDRLLEGGPRERSGEGQALEPAVRGAMDARFGFDFSKVRIHADPAVAQAAERADSAAFAVGEDVYFGPGRYDPASPAGFHLLAHELAHVVQADRAGPTEPGRELSARADVAEVEAQSAADGVLAGLSVSVGTAPSAAVSREEGHGHAGWMDRLFGLNPDRSFVEAALDPMYGQQGVFSPHADEGTGMTLLRAAGAVAGLPAAAIGAIGGHALDEINHGPLMFHGAFDK